MNTFRLMETIGEVLASVTVVMAIGLIFEYGHMV